MYKPVYCSGGRLQAGSHKEVVLAPAAKWQSEGLIILRDVDTVKTN